MIVDRTVAVNDPTARCSSRIAIFAPTPSGAFDAPLWGPRRNIAITFGVEKLERRGYSAVKKIEYVFICFDKIHERDGRTDGQIDGQTDKHRTTA